ncbi:MAG: hypothetical protein ACTSU7_01915 [Candidatus Heimdallarchaeaceae archaeon]
MNRTKFYKKTTINNINEIDFLWNSLSSFEINHTPSYYRVVGDEVGQPDLISYRVYGIERYWWVICLVNNIENPLEDIEEGSIIKVPNIRDIYDFYQSYSVR